jgi:antitoxin component YwqK of YwqJK toxin-antitoxin module
MIGKIKGLAIGALLIVVSSAAVCAEVISETNSKADGTREMVFYRRGKEVAKQIIDGGENIIETTGEIPDGIVKQYYESGKVELESNYKESKREGAGKKYYENGKLLAEMTFRDNKIDGLAKTYYEDGTLKSEMKYKNGKLEGLSKEYFESGKLRSERKYKHNQLHGVRKLYFESGNLMGEWDYKNGKRNGKTRRYYEHGGIRYINIYKDAKLVKRKEYDEKGTLTKERDFPAGKSGR